MLTIEDCVHFSELSEEEVAAIVEHDHLSLVVACENAKSLAGGAGLRSES
ncbi:MAG: hypothetical protein OES09_01385 [Gammaproteobacteria bacterium]|nr:hypothetical protein [Gammaproteobacteria bacterium]